MMKKGVHCKRKEFAPKGIIFLSFREDSSCEALGEYKSKQEVKTLSTV